MSKTDKKAPGVRKKSTVDKNTNPAAAVPPQDAPADTGKSAVTILFRGNCPKLTARAKGDLTYELGVDDADGNPCLRIAGNTSSGSYSRDWIELERIRSLLEAVIAEKPTFQAIVLKKLFRRQSANNHGFLGAILKAEAVLIAVPERPALLSVADWEPLMRKIDTLKEKGISLTDHIAIADEKRVREKSRRLSNGQTTKAKSPKDSVSAAD